MFFVAQMFRMKIEEYKKEHNPSLLKSVYGPVSQVWIEVKSLLGVCLRQQWLFEVYGGRALFLVTAQLKLFYYYWVVSWYLGITAICLNHYTYTGSTFLNVFTGPNRTGCCKMFPPFWVTHSDASWSVENFLCGSSRVVSRCYNNAALVNFRRSCHCRGKAYNNIASGGVFYIRHLL